MGVLNGEIARKSGHMPLRKLFKLAGEAVQAIKPVFMMSPLSVAQFLEPGAVEFDLLVIDEASQIEPVDALGAIARRYRVTTAQLMRWNGIKNAHKLRLGQRIRIEGR